MIEVTLNTTDMSEQEWQYPCLVMSNLNGTIVYAIGEEDAGCYTSFEGLSLNGEAPEVNTYSATWNKRAFKLYTHPITLKNI